MVLLVVLKTQGPSNINQIRLNNKFGMCDLNDLEMAAILGFLDRKTLNSTTFILVETILILRNARFMQ